MSCNIGRTTVSTWIKEETSVVVGGAAAVHLGPVMVILDTPEEADRVAAAFAALARKMRSPANGAQVLV